MHTSYVEKYFLHKASLPFLDKNIERISVLTVNNYVTLGQVTALRFLEWALENPEGVVALPAGKSARHFISWLHYFVDNWRGELNNGILAAAGFTAKQPPQFKGMRLVQMKEFFPISPDHERSFNYFIRKYYIGGFGFDERKALLFNTAQITVKDDSGQSGAYTVENIFSDGHIDLGLRDTLPANDQSRLQKRIILHFDQVCEAFEEEIRIRGGLGFFMGAIGPDGHIALNTRGTSHHSSTRITTMNYETMAAAAVDLGGIEVVRKKAIITIGLETITINPECTAIVFAAGEEFGSVVAGAVENEPTIGSPASALQKLTNARFYVTDGAAKELTQRRFGILHAKKSVSEAEIDKLVIDGARLDRIRLKCAVGAVADAAGKRPVPHWEVAEKLTGKTIEELLRKTSANLAEKIRRGLDLKTPQRFLHTGPHHDDIELAYFPLIHHLVRSAKNRNYFCYMTSGFTSVTNDYILRTLQTLVAIIKNGELFQSITRKELYDPVLKEIEIHGYLNAIAQQNTASAGVFTAMRMCRHYAEQLRTDSDYSILSFAQDQIALLESHVPGNSVPDAIKLIKSWVRQWEAELVWAHFGLDINDIYHLQLKFYSDDLFPRNTDFKDDIAHIVSLLRRIKPTTVTLAMDPEGSGPDTHYKTLLALRAALKSYSATCEEVPRIWGYRNVWSTFHPADATMIVPVSLNSFAVLHNMFNTCYLSQKSASFPSSEFEGTFSELAQKIWVEQFNDLTAFLGKSFFYSDEHPMMRRAYGAIYFKDLNFDEFLEETKEMED